MKDKFILCLSPITAGVSLAMLAAVVANGYFCVEKIFDGFDWKVAVYVLTEIVVAAVVVLMIKEMFKTGVRFTGDRVEFTAVDENNVFEYAHIVKAQTGKDTKASLKKNFVDRYSHIVIYLDDDSVVTIELGLTTKRTLNKIDTEFRNRINKAEY